MSSQHNQPTNRWILGLTQPIQHKDAPHNKIQILGMGKNIMKTKFDNGERGKMTQMIKSIQETFIGFTEAKMTSIPTQNIDLSSQLLVFTRNEFLAWIIMKKTLKFGRETLSNS